MSSQLNFIVDELNLLFPGKRYNVIALDSLNPDQFLQILSNVLAIIDAKDDIDIRGESREHTVKRILGALHILKYKQPSSEMDLVQGLLLGDKKYILPILEWLLQQRSFLEKRAYLAKYLSKIEVPTLLRGDAALEELYENYERLIEAFKDAHREREMLFSNKSNSTELRSDLSTMERERDIVVSKINNLQKSRVDGSKSATAILNQVQTLREVRSKRNTLIEQQIQLEANCSDIDRFVSHTKQRVTEARRAAHGVSPQGLLQRAEEEKRVSLYIAQEKLPADLESNRSQLEVLREVTAQTDLSTSRLAQIDQEIRSLSSEVSAQLERRMVAAGPAEDKLAPFRQQVAMLGRRKEAAAESLGTLKREAAVLRAELIEMRSQLAQADGAGSMLGEEQFRAFVIQLRARTEVYKARRGQLSAQASECGILTRTLEILNARQDAALKILAAEEARLGLSGFTVAASQLEEASATKAQIDAQKEQSLESLSQTITRLNQVIASKKTQLAPAIQELRPLREHYHGMLSSYNKAKQLYETTAANLSTTTSKLEQDKRQVEEELFQAKSQSELTKAQLEVTKMHQETLSQEIALYAGAPTNKSKSLREKLNAKIAEEDRKSRQLKDVQKRMRDQKPREEKLLEQWEFVLSIFDAKLEWLKKMKQDSSLVKCEKGAEMLVLQH